MDELTRELRTERLHRLLLTALNELRKAGRDRVADAIEKELGALDFAPATPPTAIHEPPTKTKAESAKGPVQKLESIEWLVEVLGFETRKQAYDAIASDYLPSECVVRLGRRIRINPEAVKRWIQSADAP